MILVDANLLIYARSSWYPQYEAARTWLDRKLTDGERVGLPWESLLAFLRILSHPRIVERPESVDSLWEQVDSWLGVDSVWVPLATERHAALLGKMMPHIITFKSCAGCPSGLFGDFAWTYLDE